MEYEYYITSVDFTTDEQGDKEVHVALNNGTIVKICKCFVIIFHCKVNATATVIAFCKIRIEFQRFITIF